MAEIRSTGINPELVHLFGKWVEAAYRVHNTSIILSLWTASHINEHITALHQLILEAPINGCTPEEWNEWARRIKEAQSALIRPTREGV